jgi:predicted transporter
VARGGSWLAFLVAGCIVLAAMPFYRFLGPTSRSTGCNSVGDGFICRTHLLSNGFFGMGLGSSAPGIFGNSSPNATTYWVISIFLGTCVTVGFYWVRSRQVGNGGRRWPFLTVGLGALVLGVVSRNWFSIAPTEMSIRGMQALLIIGLGLIVLAAIDHQWAVTLFVAGFLGLALLSCLYDVSNVFSRFGLGSRWPVDDQTLPNLIVPGIYLLVGGVVFWAFHHWKSVGRLEPRS